MVEGSVAKKVQKILTRKRPAMKSARLGNQKIYVYIHTFIIEWQHKHAGFKNIMLNQYHNKTQ